LITPQRTKEISHAAACGLILLGVVGCGQGTMAKVSGTVTWQGKPVPDAMVAFVHKNRPGATGRTDAAGRFSLTTFQPGDGAHFGSFRVAIEPFKPGSGPDAAPPSPLERPKPAPERKDIPEVYRSPATSPLTAEVVAGKMNVIDFKLD
jgi:hypothetical protein